MNDNILNYLLKTRISIHLIIFDFFLINKPIMTPKATLIVFALALLINSCKFSNTKNENHMPALQSGQNETSQFIISPKDIETPLNLSDAIDTFFYVAPETRPDALLRWGEAELINDRVYIFDGMSTKAFCYTLDGKFIKNVIKEGNGPKEMIRPYSMYYDAMDNLLLFCDRSRKSIHFVDLNGKYLKEVKIGTWIMCVSRLTDGSYVVLTDGREDSNLLIYSSDFSTHIPLGVKLDNYTSSHSGTSRPLSHMPDGSVNFAMGFYDTVLNVSPGNIAEKYTFNFGELTIPDNIMKRSPKEIFMALKSRTSQLAGDIFKFSESDNHTVFKFSYSPLGKNLTCLISKSTFEYRYFYQVDFAGHRLEGSWFQQSGEWFVGEITDPPIEIRNLDGTKPQPKNQQEAEFIERVKQRKPTDNPIYVFFKLKADF
jgi:hypothetical protein